MHYTYHMGKHEQACTQKNNAVTRLVDTYIAV